MSRTIRVTENRELEKGFDARAVATEAARCLLCHDAPCSAACPAVTDQARLIRSLRFSNLLGASETIRENNLLGTSCSRIYPVNELCEDAGTALFAHAVELAREGCKVTIFEETAQPGGMPSFCIPPFRLPQEIVDFDLSRIGEMGIEFFCDTRLTSHDLDNRLERYDAVFVGTGLMKPKTLDLPGKELEGVHQAIDWDDYTCTPTINERCVGYHLCLNVCPVADCILPRHTEFKPGQPPHPVILKQHYR